MKRLIVKKSGDVLTSPWVIALLPLLLTMLLTQGLFDKYRLELLSRQLSGNGIYCYRDLDYDGNSEWIRFVTYENAQVLVYTIDEKLEEVYNLPGIWTSNRRSVPTFFFGDADGDDMDEIFAFTVNSGDSLFISHINHYPDGELVQNRFIHKLSPISGNYDYMFTPIGLEDNNGDSFPEFLFVVNVGYPLQPRAIFAWDIKNDSIYRSPLMGASIKLLDNTFTLKDVDSDGVKEIFVRTTATDNYSDSIPYPDNDSWLMVFTKNLGFLFEPVKIEGAQTETTAFPCRTLDSLSIGAFIHSGRKNKKHSTFQFYDTSGKFLKKISFPELNRARGNQFITVNNNYYIHSIIYEEHSFLHFIPEKKKVENLFGFQNSSGAPLFFDCDNNGGKEVIYLSEMEEKIYIIQMGSRNTSSIELPPKTGSTARHVSLSKRNGKKDRLLVVWNGVANYLKYHRNPMYYANFVLALLYYFLLVLAFTLLKRIWQKNLHRQQQTEQEMQQLQMQTVMNQLNPHFTYNAINTVGAAILQNDSRKAYDSLTRVSRLLRKSVDHAFVPYKTLGQEIDFVYDYLEVEKLRFGDKMRYNLQVDKTVNLATKIPKMLIQIFVENAIKHGLFHKKDGGRINIDIVQLPGGVEITVEDNGIGRQQALEHSNGKQGKGMIILRNYLRLFKEQFNREITFAISDIFENDQPAGTRVHILIKK